MKRLHKFKSLLSIVAVQDADRDIFDIERCCRGKDDQLDRGGKQDRDAAFRVAHHGEQFFPNQGQDAFNISCIQPY